MLTAKLLLSKTKSNHLGMKSSQILPIKIDTFFL